MKKMLKWIGERVYKYVNRNLWVVIAIGVYGKACAVIGHYGTMGINLKWFLFFELPLYLFLVWAVLNVYRTWYKYHNRKQTKDLMKERDLMNDKIPMKEKEIRDRLMTHNRLIDIVKQYTNQRKIFDNHQDDIEITQVEFYFRGYNKHTFNFNTHVSIPAKPFIEAIDIVIERCKKEIRDIEESLPLIQFETKLEEIQFETKLEE